MLLPQQLHDSPVWNCVTGVSCERTAEKMAQVVSAMLRNCREAAFVAPYFGPTPRHCHPLLAFLRAMLDRRPGSPPDRVMVLTSTKPELGTPAFFAAECARILPGFVPRGLQVFVRRLQERPRSERLHNRYILTDIGGVLFGVGLDNGNSGDTDDVTLLGRVQLILRRDQYLGARPVFDTDGTDVVVNGIARL